MTMTKEMAEEVAAMANLIKIATEHGTKFARFAAEANKRVDELLAELDDPSQNRTYPRAVTPPAGPANSEVQLEPGEEPVQVSQTPPGSEPLGRHDRITGEAVHGGLSESRPTDEIDAEAEKAQPTPDELHREYEANRDKPDPNANKVERRL